MSLMETLLDGQHDAVIEQVAAKLGIDPAQAQQAMAQLMPALAGGLKHQLATGNAPAVADALHNPDNKQYVDAPETLADHDTQQGSDIAHTLLGSKAAEAVTDKVASATGISPDTLRQMLPMAASLFAGAMAKQAASNGGGLKGLMGMFGTATAPGAPVAAGGGLLGTLNNLLDANKDGSAVDDILGFIKSKVA